MFEGEHHAQIDRAGRLELPAAFTEEATKAPGAAMLWLFDGAGVSGTEIRCYSEEGYCHLDAGIGALKLEYRRALRRAMARRGRTVAVKNGRVSLEAQWLEQLPEAPCSVRLRGQGGYFLIEVE